MTTVALTLWPYAEASDLTLFLYAEEDSTNAIANGAGDTLTPGNEGSFTATVSEPLSGIYNVVVKQSGTVVASGGKVNFDGSATVFVDAASAFDLSAIQSAISAAILESGALLTSAPVINNGTIPQIVIGDDYKAASSRAFAWYVPVPVFSMVGSKCYFGGASKHRGSWLIQGTITAVTVDSVAKWRLQFELAASDTIACLPGCYDWSVELRGPSPEQITKMIGTTELIEAYTRP